MESLAAPFVQRLVKAVPAVALVADEVPSYNDAETGAWLALAALGTEFSEKVARDIGEDRPIPADIDWRALFEWFSRNWQSFSAAEVELIETQVVEGFPDWSAAAVKRTRETLPKGPLTDSYERFLSRYWPGVY